jgi:hypothetical protein
MILDQNLRLGATGAITSAATYITGTSGTPDVVDLQSNTAYLATVSGSLYTVGQGTQNRDIGEGRDLYVYFSVTTALAGGTNATFQVVASSSSTLASGNVVVGEVGPIVTASLGLGQQVAVRVSPQLLGSAGLRYLGAQVVTTGTHSAGAVIADVVMDIQDGKRAYASGFSVA